MGTFSGEATLSFLFILHISKGVNSLRKEFAPGEQILSLKGEPHFKKSLLSREANRMTQKLILFTEMAGKQGRISIHFNYSFFFYLCKSQHLETRFVTDILETLFRVFSCDSELFFLTEHFRTTESNTCMYLFQSF